MKGARTITAATLALAPALVAQPRDTTTTIRINAFVDTYYAWSSNRPSNGERQFTTQAVRHDEMNVNLAWLGVTLQRERTRARLALQAGTSVQANYAGEPRNGPTSGPDVARFLQEAVVGVKLAEQLWLDGGVYYSYIGLEGWSSGDNPTYTRSLVADYSPYYLSGARLTWTPTSRVTTQVHVVNGWQNISENNRSKAVGARVDYAVTPALTVSYANFFGNEQPTARPARTRNFNQLMAKGTLPTGTLVQGQVDLGRETDRRWYGPVAIARHPVSARVALSARVERFSDPDEVIIATSRPDGFVGNGVSAGVDVALDRGVAWRSEFRSLRSTAPIFVSRSTGFARQDHLLVRSLSVAF